ncbi:hypothetical protein [Saccharopolyspora taberi]|uniref:PE family protein n=1 Tax=Saccharopolyspora taberi TaxID=60895 RepID=A0ABN3VJ39_9PSEU
MFDSARSAVIHTAVNAGGVAQQASFSVDVDRIPALITQYKEARDKLASIVPKATRLGTIVVPPGEDEISGQLTKALNQMAGGKPGSLLEAVNDGIKRLNHQIAQLEAALRDYQAADEAATPSQA